MNTRISPALAGLLMLAFAATCHAGDDKIATDRPDFVESSDVVGKGRFQVETSISRERDGSGSQRIHTTATPTLLRAGISETLELRVESDGRIHTSGFDNARGWADTSVGIKWHALDAVDNAPSVGVLLHADLATGSRPFRGEGVRPSLRVVGEWDLPADMSLGVMPGLSYETDEDGRRFTNGILGIVVGKEFNARWRGFVELSAPQIARARNGGSQVSFDTGVAYLVNDNCQLDFAVARGLNKRTPDFSWTVGLSFKM
jgi:hypothetical protein